MMRSGIIILLLLAMVPASARMYQWSDPDSGRTHFSGEPPAWYRSDANGPRVFVFERGQLVDDTGVAVSAERRRTLRQQALVKAADDQEAARQRTEQSAALREQLETGNAALPPQLPQAAAESTLAPGMIGKAPEEIPLTEEQANELRALVADWEARNEAVNQQQARGITEPDQPPAATDSDTTSTPPISREELFRYLDSQAAE